MINLIYLLQVLIPYRLQIYPSLLVSLHHLLGFFTLRLIPEGHFVPHGRLQRKLRFINLSCMESCLLFNFLSFILSSFFSSLKLVDLDFPL